MIRRKLLIMICMVLASLRSVETNASGPSRCESFFSTNELIKKVHLLGSQMSSNQSPYLSALREATQSGVSNTLPGGGLLPVGPNLYRASIGEIRFQYFSAPESSGRQLQSNWCWAACIKMVLNYYGIPISQEDIVQYNFGELIDRPGSSQEILKTLNNFFINMNQEIVRPTAALIDPTQNIEWIQLVANGKPVIAGLAGASAGVTGHAYVIKSVDFSFDPDGVGILVHSVTFADPWPSSPSETTLSWSEFTNRQLGVFVVR